MNANVFYSYVSKRLMGRDASQFCTLCVRERASADDSMCVILLFFVICCLLLLISRSYIHYQIEKISTENLFNECIEFKHFAFKCWSLSAHILK